MGAALDHLTVVVEVAVVVDAIELQKAVLRIVAILHGLLSASWKKARALALAWRQ